MRCVHRRGKGICLSCARRERRGCISCRGPRLKSGLREGLETLEDTDAGDFPNQDADQLLEALRNRLNLDYISDIPGAVGGKTLPQLQRYLPKQSDSPEVWEKAAHYIAISRRGHLWRSVGVCRNLGPVSLSADVIHESGFLP